jgi:CDGSH-type Zn-finger protein/mannose-6-phosphate isomerase-like protein (cupin superfamily)
MSGAGTPPRIAHRKGFYYEVKAGKRYLWCSCGRSENQPFCDGSHVGSEFLPIAFKAERDEDVIFCGCKHTGTGPFCDGAHSNLPGGYLTDDPDSVENQNVRAVAPSASPIVPLDGQCYVFSTSRATLTPRGAMRHCAVVTPALGALFQSQFYAEVALGASPVVSADGRHTVLFVTEGDGEIEISGHRIAVGARTGVYIRPSEAYRVHNYSLAPLKFFISNGPGSEELVWLDEMPTAFEAQYPRRDATIDPSQRHKMAERYYQMLVNR